MTRTEIIVGVDDKDTGLRGSVDKVIAKLEAMERRMYIAIGIGYAVMFLLEKFWK